MSDKTALRVYWAGNLRIHNCNSCCRRWYFTFNGAECSAPAAIDGVVYMAYGTGGKFTKNLHRPRHIEGVCEKLRKGTVHVGFWVGNSVLGLDLLTRTQAGTQCPGSTWKILFLFCKFKVL